MNQEFAGTCNKRCCLQVCHATYTLLPLAVFTLALTSMQWTELRYLEDTNKFRKDTNSSSSCSRKRMSVKQSNQPKSTQILDRDLCHMTLAFADPQVTKWYARFFSSPLSNQTTSMGRSVAWPRHLCYWLLMVLGCSIGPSRSWHLKNTTFLHKRNHLSNNKPPKLAETPP